MIRSNKIYRMRKVIYAKRKTIPLHGNGFYTEVVKRGVLS